MRTVDEILEQVRHLSVREQQEFMKRFERLRGSLPGERDGERPPAPDNAKGGPLGTDAWLAELQERDEEFEAQRLAALDSFLALAGTGHSDFTDVSSQKGKHLAEVYSPKTGRR